MKLHRILLVSQDEPAFEFGAGAMSSWISLNSFDTIDRS